MRKSKAIASQRPCRVRQRVGYALLIFIGVTALRGQTPPISAESPPPAWHYYYFKKPRSLTLDVTRVAIHPVVPSGAYPPSRLAGESDQEDMSLPMTGWRVPFLDTADRNADGIQRLVADALKSPEVAFVSPLFSSDTGGTVVVMPEILVGFDEDVDETQAAALLDNAQAGEVLARHWSGMRNVYRLRSPLRSGFEVLAVANRLAESDGVLFAEPNVFFSGRGGLIPNDPFFSMSWGLHNIGQSLGAVDIDLDAPEAWDITLGGADQVVVIIDTGVDPFHPDLNLISGADTTDDGPGDGRPFNSFDNHGTAVAGCVSAKINNWMGSAGIAPASKVASARTFRTVSADGGWVSQSSWTVEALSWAESIGARITNNSNAYDFISAAIDTKYAQTRDNGMIHFASVHNDGEEIITYPALLPSVNAVAAVDRFGKRPWFGNYGPGVDFAAPGHEILSTDRSGADGYVAGDYLIGSGTSFAAPYAAGVAALILSRNPTLASPTVERILNDTCTDLGEPGYDLEFGWGVVNAAQAVAMADPAMTGACCVAGKCQDDVTAVACQSQGGDQPDGRWFGGKPCTSILCPPANTRCEVAAVISDSDQFMFDNSTLTNLPAPVYDCGLGDFHDGTLWFKFTASQTSVRIHTCGSSALDSTFAVYDACGASREIGCGEDDERCAASPFLSDQCVVGLTPGEDYYIQFSAWSSGDRGAYSLSLQSPCPPAAPLPEANPVPRTRALALWVAPSPLSTTAPGSESAIRVTLLDLQNPDPPNSPAYPAPDFSSFESGPNCSDPLQCVRWVGRPYEYQNHASVPASGTFRSARLQCTPYYHNWTTEGLVHVIGAEIMPSSTYDVQLVPIECAGNESNCAGVSAALSITTARHGDVVAPFNPPNQIPQPDALDISALVDRFKFLPGAPSKPSAQIQPNSPEPNQDVSGLEILAGVDAFKGLAYPFHGPCPCPSTVTCNLTPCNSVNACSGGTCTKVCTGGTKDGNPCNDDIHCPSGMCGAGYCRDACKRCTP